MADSIYLVHLDGGDEHPELTCDLTVQASSEKAAIEFALEHNGDVEASVVKKVN